MRLLQHSVRNAFVICVLLGSTPVIAATTYFAGILASTPGYDFSSSQLTIPSMDNSSTVERETLRCMVWFPLSGVYYSGVSECNATHIATLKPVCTIDSQPYSPGMNVQGVSYDIYQRHQGQTSTYDVTEELPTTASSGGGNSIVYLGVKARRDGFHVGDLSGGYSEARVECTYSNVYVTAIGSAIIGQLQPSVVYPFVVRANAMLSVSVEQPSPVIGKLMREFDAPFKMTVTNAQPSQSLSMTWDVGAPCDSWSPSLRLPDSSVLGIHHVDSGRLPSGTSIMTAKFTPTALGAFSCTGTLNVSLD